MRRLEAESQQERTVQLWRALVARAWLGLLQVAMLVHSEVPRLAFGSKVYLDW